MSMDMSTWPDVSNFSKKNIQNGLVKELLQIIDAFDVQLHNQLESLSANLKFYSRELGVYVRHSVCVWWAVGLCWRASLATLSVRA